MTESEREAQARKVWKQEKPACTCTPVNPRHKEGWYCVTREQLDAWRKWCPDSVAALFNKHLSPGDNLRMAWLWLQFSQDPEARRLSGREVKADLGGDRWDDAAGMTELEKGMFE